MCNTHKVHYNNAKGYEAGAENMGGYESWMEVVCMLVKIGELLVS